MKKTLLILAILSFISMPVFADESGLKEFLMGNDPDDALKADLYIAKTFKDVKAPIIGETNIRVKFERETEIDNWSHAEYKVSTGLEF